MNHKLVAPVILLSAEVVRLLVLFCSFYHGAFYLVFLYHGAWYCFRPVKNAIFTNTPWQSPRYSAGILSKLNIPLLHSLKCLKTPSKSELLIPQIFFSISSTVFIFYLKSPQVAFAKAAEPRVTGTGVLYLCLETGQTRLFKTRHSIAVQQCTQ